LTKQHSRFSTAGYGDLGGIKRTKKVEGKRKPERKPIKQQWRELNSLKKHGSQKAFASSAIRADQVSNKINHWERMQNHLREESHQRMA